MGRANKHELKKRQAEALQMLSDGYGTSELATLLSDKWGGESEDGTTSNKSSSLGNGCGLG